MLVAAACGGDDSADTTTTVAAADTTTTTAAEETTTTATTTTGPAARDNVDGTLTIGYLLPSTGDLAVLGPPMINAVEMAIRDINEAGGVLGRDVALVASDDGTNEQIASSSVERLLSSERVDAIVGAAASRITLAVIDRITGAGVVQCSPSNTGAALTDYPDDGFYFRTAPPDNLQGPALADAIAADGYSNIGIIALNDEYGQGFARFLQEGIVANGGTVAVDIAYDPAGTNFDADVDQLAAADPEAIVLIAFPDTGSRIITTMIERGIGPADRPLYLTDGMQSDELWELIDPGNPAVLEGVRGTAPAAAPESGAAHFPSAFAEFAPGVSTIFSAHAYDCAVIIALAAAVADTDDPGVFADEMVGVTGEPGTVCDTVAACMTLIEDGEEVNYLGASGPLDFIEVGEPAAGTYDVYEYQADGSFETLTQVDVG